MQELLLFEIGPSEMASAIEHFGGKVKITTERLVLRAAKVEDTEALYEALRDPAVMKYW